MVNYKIKLVFARELLVIVLIFYYSIDIKLFVFKVRNLIEL